MLGFQNLRILIRNILTVHVLSLTVQVIWTIFDIASFDNTCIVTDYFCYEVRFLILQHYYVLQLRHSVFCNIQMMWLSQSILYLRYDAMFHIAILLYYIMWHLLSSDSILSLFLQTSRTGALPSRMWCSSTGNACPLSERCFLDLG